MFSLQSITSQSRAVTQFLNKSQSDASSNPSQNSLYDHYFGSNNKNSSTMSQLNNRLYDQFNLQSSKLDTSIAQISSGMSLLEYGADTTKKVGASLQSLNEIALKATSASITSDERGSLQLQAQELQLSIKSQVSEAEYDGQKILSSNTIIEIQYKSTSIGSSSLKTQDLQKQLENAGLNSLDLTTTESSKKSLQQIQSMLNQTSKTQGLFEKQSRQLKSSLAGFQANATKVNALKSYFSETAASNSFSNRLREQFSSSSLLAYKAQANISSSQMMKIFGARTL